MDFAQLKVRQAVIRYRRIPRKKLFVRDPECLLNRVTAVPVSDGMPFGAIRR